MALWARRQRQYAQQEALARGELPWTTAFDEAARNKLRYAFLDSTPTDGYGNSRRDEVAKLARRWILRAEGMPSLVGYDHHAALSDLAEFYAKCPTS